MLEIPIILELVRDAVRAEISAVPSTPALLDRAGLARALSCSPSTVDNLRKRGMPVIWIGDTPRFQLDVVVAWLKGNGSEA